MFTSERVPELDDFFFVMGLEARPKALERDPNL
jgi:hypothetical protein